MTDKVPKIQKGLLAMAHDVVRRNKYSGRKQRTVVSANTLEFLLSSRLTVFVHRLAIMSAVVMLKNTI